MGEQAKIVDLLNRYRSLEGLGVQLGQPELIRRPNEFSADKIELGPSKIPWWAHAVFATTFAGVLAAIPFGVRLPFQLAAVLALIIFPAMIIAYLIAMRS